MAYKLYEGSVSIVPVEKDGQVTLFVNKKALKWGNEFSVPQETEELVTNLEANASKSVRISCNTTQVLGKEASNSHTLKEFRHLAELYEVVVSIRGWAPYMAFQPGPGQMVGRERAPVKLAPGAIKRK